MAYEAYLVYLQNPAARSLLIITGSILLAGLIDLVLIPLILRLTRKTHTDLDDKIFGIIKRPVFSSVILIGVIVALSLLGLTEQTEFYIRTSSLSLLAVIWGITLTRLFDVVTDSYARKIGFDMMRTSQQMIPFIQKITKVVVLVLVGLVILNLWGINITPLLASAGILGLAIAFAARDTIANIFGGVSVFVDRPYKIGDYVIVDQDRGKVIDIGLRSTKIKTRDNILISIPNSIMATTKIINETGFDPTLRLRISFGVAYGTNLKKMEKVVMDIVKKNKYVLDSPDPRVRFRKFGDSSLEFELLCWVKEPELKGKAVHFLNSEIHDRFAKEKITIPFPQRDVHLKK